MGAVSLSLVRHGESTANIAATTAEAARAEVIDAPLRDADVPLSQVGAAQALAVGDWLRGLPDDQFPTALWCSPYLRAADTARLVCEGQRAPLPVRVDERLRDRELGILDALTTVGVEARLPMEAARRRRLGKFYYRPPGGESWADVALRLRFVLADIDREHDGGRVLLITHDAVITLARYICENLSEAQVLELARATPLLNASVSRLLRPSGAGAWQLDYYNRVEHIQRSEAPVTVHTGDRDVFPR
ncbi:histidine phosphatase family protein [Salinibacterium sp. ZJ450]|uniref:histidine phosphatase family protein n=1 Tax=Salinibacterium sp. ZJ450 TaxID=2708338 RepID=UPI00141F5106|nr:histidine phosphatase family protein [Salinibacterium sp. ZJ450]